MKDKLVIPMRLTSETIDNSEQGLNCIGDRELVLRNKAIPVIENLAVARDAFDTIDLSVNMISVLGDGFPPFPRLQSLYLGANRITRIMKGMADSLPNLRVLVLTANRLATLEDLNLPELSRLSSLEVLSIMDNPVASIPATRQTIIDNIPTLKVLNFTKVTQHERKNALENNPPTSLGKRASREQSKRASKRRRVTAKNNIETFDIGRLGDPTMSKSSQQPKRAKALTQEQSDALKEYVTNATTLQQVTRMQEAMRNGTVQQFLASIAGKAEKPNVDAPA